MGYHQRVTKRLSERGRKMAQARWRKDRERQEALARRDPDPARGIARRIIVIEEERRVREVTIYEDDCLAKARRKVREVLYPRAGDFYAREV
jgi:hypothetical protein